MQKRGPTPIGDAIQAFLRDAGIGGRQSDRRVLDAWGEALDEPMRSRTTAVAFRRNELVVEVDSAALLQELRGFTGDACRKQVNQRLGSERIRRVVFKLKG